MNEYLVHQSYLTNKIIDWLGDLYALEKQVDKLYKINLYLLRKYKDDLLKEFDIQLPESSDELVWIQMLETAFNQSITYENESLMLSIIIARIEEEMNKEMPEPWYCYGIGTE